MIILNLGNRKRAFFNGYQFLIEEEFDQGLNLDSVVLEFSDLRKLLKLAMCHFPSAVVPRSDEDLNYTETESNFLFARD